MAVALEAFGEILGTAVAIACLFLVVYIAEGIAKFMDVSIGPWRPLEHVATWIRNGIVHACNRAIADLETHLKALLHRLLYYFEEVIFLGVIGVIIAGQELTYLWHKITRSYIPYALHPLRSAISTIRHDVSKLQHLSDHIIAEIWHSITAYVGAQVSAVYKTLKQDLATLETGTADAITQAITTSEQDIAKAIDAAASGGTSALKAIQAAEAHAIDIAERGGEDALAELQRLLGGQNVGVLAALLASIPLTKALVDAIATEAGLGDAACRHKVGKICSTDGNGWEMLLAGLAPLAVALTLKDLLPIAQEGFSRFKHPVQAAGS